MIQNLPATANLHDPKPSNVLWPYEADILIGFLFYTMGQDLRARIREEFPVIYQKLTGVRP